MSILTFTSFSGMTWEVSRGDESDCRVAAAKILRKRRKTEHFVRKIKANFWECSEPENCFMIPDTAGYLKLDTDNDNDY
jgi:hypothetical protein